jgi:hypothetical protein
MPFVTLIIITVLVVVREFIYGVVGQMHEAVIYVRIVGFLVWFRAKACECHLV